MRQYKTYLACFLIGFLVTYLVTPLVIRLARRLKALDRPADRKVHGRVVPRLGGVGLFVGLWVPILALCFYDNVVIQQVLAGEHQLLLLFFGSASMLALGIADDIHGLNARWKFGAQLPVAVILVAAGVRFDSINFPYLGQVSLGGMGPMISVVWLVGVTNALNLIDGIDGLASGVVYLIAMTLAFLALDAGNVLLVVMMFALAGACMGFLRHNLHPAKIFLGDSGSLFLGMTLAVAVTLGSFKQQLGTSLLLPVILLGYPIADTLLSMTRRYLKGKPMFSGDASHIHHRLLHKGFEHRKVCLVLYSVCLAFCLWSLAISRQHIPFMIAGLIVVAALSIFGVHSLGYLNYLRLPRDHGERSRFRAVNFFAEMIKAKLGGARTREEIIQLLEAGSAEFQQPALQIHVPDAHHSDVIESSQRGFRLNGEPGAQPPQGTLHDRYKFEDTGLVVDAYASPDPAAEELITEKRRLFGEICVAANQRLSALGRNGSTSVRRSDGPTVRRSDGPTVRRSDGTVTRRPTHRPPSTVHRPPSTVHRPPPHRSYA